MKKLALVGLLTLVSQSVVVDAEVFGKKKKGLKGRYLEVESSVRLSDYRGALAVVEPTEITSDKDQPVDTESVRVTSDDALANALRGLSGISDVVAEVPLELPEGMAILRVKTKLTLQFGSQAMRAWVGGGAGKSKLHIAVEFFDARSGRRLARFNGYGTGSGSWSVSGGGVQRMARDDLEENYQALRDYLIQAGL